MPRSNTAKRSTSGGSANVTIAKRAPTARHSVSAAAFEPNARARALLRGAEIAAKDLTDAGGAYTLEQVQVLLNDVSRQSVDKKVKAGELLTVPGPSNIRRYPAIQFNDDRTVVAGLKDVQAALPGKTGWAVLNFLIHPDPRLSGQCPIDLLRRGKTTEVVAAAKLVGKLGA
jgi:hypothetical protein